MDDSKIIFHQIRLIDIYKTINKMYAGYIFISWEYRYSTKIPDTALLDISLKFLRRIMQIFLCPNWNKLEINNDQENLQIFAVKSHDQKECLGCWHQWEGEGRAERV
jgi:hypothetical protein